VVIGSYCELFVAIVSYVLLLGYSDLVGVIVSYCELL